MKPLHVIFDTVIFVQALSNADGPAAECWRLVERGFLIHHVCGITLKELRDVLTRPKFLARVPVEEHVANEFVESVKAISRHHFEIPKVFSYPRDPKEQPFLDLAIANAVEYLVTWDKDLLVLKEMDSDEGNRLRFLIPELLIVTPPELLSEIKQRSIRNSGSTA